MIFRPLTIFTQEWWDTRQLPSWCSQIKLPANEERAREPDRIFLRLWLFLCHGVNTWASQTVSPGHRWISPATPASHHAPLVLWVQLSISLMKPAKNYYEHKNHRPSLEGCGTDIYVCISVLDIPMWSYYNCRSNSMDRGDLRTSFPWQWGQQWIWPLIIYLPLKLLETSVKAVENQFTLLNKFHPAHLYLSRPSLPLSLSHTHTPFFLYQTRCEMLSRPDLKFPSFLAQVNQNWWREAPS